jgi:putative flippase GtrA
MKATRGFNLKQFVLKGVKFGMVGAVGAVLNLAILYVLVNFGHLYYIYSEVVAIIIVFGFNYMGNILVGNIKIDRAQQGKAP